jgi:hypothetical protein
MLWLLSAKRLALGRVAAMSAKPARPGTPHDRDVHVDGATVALRIVCSSPVAQTCLLHDPRKDRLFLIRHKSARQSGSPRRAALKQRSNDLGFHFNHP